MNVDTFKLTGDNLTSVHSEPDEDEEMIFAELYKELMVADTRNTRSQRGRGVRVGGGKGLIIRRTSTPTPTTTTQAGSGLLTYMRRGSNSSNPIHHDSTPLFREPYFDDEGNLLSESEHESETDPSLLDESSPENSLDELSDDDISDDDSDWSS